jgi:hypothetical protein
MYVMIFDTETTGLDKPFCYDVGYFIVDTDRHFTAEQRHFVIEQVWHNLPLFESAYYKDKRPQYVQLMRKRLAIMDKWGYVMQQIKRDLRKYNVTDAYAYNSDFDDKVFTFNCDWFKCNNPLEDIAIHDIWGYASQYITNTLEYKAFCETHSFFTDTGNYKASAEIVYRYLSGVVDFEEKHMGLYDVEIEAFILDECIQLGAEWNLDYKVNRVLPRQIEKPFQIFVDGECIVSDNYIKKYVRNDIYKFTTAQS